MRPHLLKSSGAWYTIGSDVYADSREQDGPTLVARAETQELAAEIVMTQREMWRLWEAERLAARRR